MSLRFSYANYVPDLGHGLEWLLAVADLSVCSGFSGDGIVLCRKSVQYGKIKRVCFP